MYFEWSLCFTHLRKHFCFFLKVHKDPTRSPFLMSGCKVADGYGSMLVSFISALEFYSFFDAIEVNKFILLDNSFIGCQYLFYVLSDHIVITNIRYEICICMDIYT